jgi:hypothetical protein
MKAIKRLAEAAKENFNSTDAKIESDKAAYMAESTAWKADKNGELSAYSTTYSNDMDNRYGEEAEALTGYEGTVTTGIDMLVDNPEELDSDLSKIAAELESDKAAVNADIAASIASELAKRNEFIAEFGEVAEFDVAVDHAYVVTGI